jgi:FkbM family methyltransferase
MFDKIHLLKQKGYNPNIILDIGAYHGNWTESMLQIYSDSKYYLFEAINYNELNRYNGFTNIQKYNVLLNDVAREVDWFELKNTGDSMFKEKTCHFTNCNSIKKQSIDLDTFSITNNIIAEQDSNILIKIDCQGAEIPILKGASKILEKTDFIILETPFFGQYNESVPSFLDHIKYMDSIGFAPYDLLENHYINGFNMQIDIMFINKNHSFNTTVNKLLL